MYFTHFRAQRASSRAKDSAGSAEGAESLESLVESVGSQILLRALPQKCGVCAARAGMAVSMRKFSVEVAQNGEASAPANLHQSELSWATEITRRNLR